MHPLAEKTELTHPLADFVLTAFTPENRRHDTTTIAAFMAGATSIRIPKRKPNAMNAYLVVAADVLGCLVDDGKLLVDRTGWYVRKP